ncbi:hypothetical protein NQ315_017571 [Exocentrus adspersus]|uniref:HAT C-terminal dimerisation domain-containing protein n=1 Tax=Exocentrus adspersus TaxID=1586481 RepID=A0AAV8VIV7_9CUCU|nr:hypothetical protein NQ315_017571 [Exocentrus adspersus]
MNPNIVCIRCSCHLSCLKLPRSVEDLLRNIGAHFNRSSLRRDKLKEFQCFFNTEIHRILSSATPRWLSLKAVVDRVLEQYQPLKYYFRETLLEDPSVTTENILNTILKSHFYIGVAASETFNCLKSSSDVSKTDLENFLKSCLQFYVELVTQIKERFNFRDSIYDLVSIVDPKIAQLFHQKSLHNEWRRHALLDHKSLNSPLINNDVEKYWIQIFNLRHSNDIPLFPNLKIVIQFLLLLPFSNASVESIFSDLFNIKTDHRNLLDTNTIKAIFFSKKGISNEEGINAFEPTKDMLRTSIWGKKQ